MCAREAKKRGAKLADLRDGQGIVEVAQRVKLPLLSLD